METKICVFEKNAISFSFDKENSMMVNATEMAKAFGAEVAHFMGNKETKLFIESCLKTRNSEFLGVKNVDDLYISRQKSGTWMHRVPALKFAAWLSPDFEVWVYSTIEKLMFGKHVEREKSLERSITLQNEMKQLTDKPNKTGDDFERYLQIERELAREKTTRKKLTEQSVHEMRDLFESEEQ